jgi:ABC-type phosphate/phosphonate transport system substrate-binding protein
MKELRIPKLPLAVIFVCMAFMACNTNPTQEYQPTFSSENAKEDILVMGFPNFSYSETAAPLIQYLNAHMKNTRIKVQACVNWDEYIKLLYEGKFDITLVNGIVASDATRHGYSIHGKLIGIDPYTSLIITKKNSGIGQCSDLKGKKVALVPSNIIPASMMGMYYMYQNGLDVNLYIHKIAVASFEAGIISVYSGESDAAICPRRNWNIYIKEHPEIISKVGIQWETSSVEANALLLKNSVDPKVRSALTNILFSMRDKKDAKSVLEKFDIKGFEAANIETYRSMLEFKKKYDSVIF